MNFKKAKETISENKRLIGIEIEDERITNLIVVPLNDENLKKILDCVSFGTRYEHLLLNYTDFKVLAVFDIDQLPGQGYVTYKDLDAILASL